MEAITKLQDVRPGDIFLGPIGGLTGVGVGIGEFLVDGGFRVGTVDVRHAGIVVEAYPGTSYYPQFPNGVTDEFRLAQAMPGGAEVATMTYATHWTDRCVYVRLPEDYPGQAADAAAAAQLMVEVGVAYSFTSYLALAAWHWGFKAKRLERWIGRRQRPMILELPSTGAEGSRSAIPAQLPVEAICSVFVDQAWTLVGKKVMHDVPHQCVTPSMLASALLRTDGVVLGWPGDHPIDS